MLKTKPIIDTSGVGCSKLFIRFKTLKTQNIYHHLGDSLGAALMAVSYVQLTNMVEIRYINQAGMVLKSISYAREDVLELTMEESVCEVEAL